MWLTAKICFDNISPYVKGGKARRHFTWDACPVYHNVTAAWCVAAGEERAAATTARRRAVAALHQRPRAMPTIEQRAYQLKVKVFITLPSLSTKNSERFSPARCVLSPQRVRMSAAPAATAANYYNPVGRGLPHLQWVSPARFPVGWRWPQTAQNSERGYKSLCELLAVGFFKRIAYSFFKDWQFICSSSGVMDVNGWQ